MFETKERFHTLLKAVIVAALISIFALLIVGRLFKLQVTDHKYYLDKVLNNIQKETVIPAKRGVIYDRNKNLLATNITVWRVFISPGAIKEYEDDNKVSGTAELISTNLSEILGVDYDTIYEKTQKHSGNGKYDQTIKKNVEKEEADKVKAFISEHKLSRFIFLEQGTKRYYPGGTLASHVIGAMGTDMGLFGLEYQYNDAMSGTNGVYVIAKDALGNELPNEYEKYIEANDGYSVVTTLDTKIQSILDNQLKLAYEENRAGNRVCGVVMDVHDGSILASGVYPNFNLNSPYELDEKSMQKLISAGLEEGTMEYTELKNKLMYAMWNNKVITDTYYPGSTFKPITSSMAFQENVINENSVFTCTGVYDVLGSKIHCSKTTGHGTHEFSYMLQQSCNPTLMQVAQKIGTSKFMKYFNEFGYNDKTGIDLPGETKGIVFDPDKFGQVDLAVSSFGQGFTTTVLQQITAICAVANGGYVVTPHMVSSLEDSDGNTVVNYDYTTKRQILSAETSGRISEVLREGTVSGGSKNAYVAGFRVAAKTGTSEKIGVINPDTGEDDMVVGSCVAYAPAENPEIAIIIMVDEPNPTSGNRYGGIVAAPYVSKALEQILPYIGVEPEYSEEEMESLNLTVGKYVGLQVGNAKKNIESSGVKCEIVGNGSYVIAQIPEENEVMRKLDGKVIIYTGDKDSSIEDSGLEIEYSDVPNVVGSYTYQALAALKQAGFNVKITGALNYNEGTFAGVTSQNISEGSKLPKGSVIVINSMHLTNVED